VTAYRFMDGASGRPGNGPGSPAAYSGNFLCGIVWTITTQVCWLNGYYWWCPAGGDTGSQKFCLWDMTSASTQVLVPSSTATSGTLTQPIPPTTIAVGRFAAPTNIGRHFSDRFAFVPQSEARLGIQWAPNVMTYVGYSFLYMNKVARPGDQIDRNIDLSQIPTAFEYNPAVPGAVPRVPFTQSYFWAQGIDVGLEISY